MSNLPATVAEPMSASTASRLVARLAMLGVRAIDCPHSKIPGLRLVGFVVRTDEHSKPNEGIDMMIALQQMAGIDLDVLHDRILDAMDAPLIMPTKGPPHV